MPSIVYLNQWLGASPKYASNIFLPIYSIYNCTTIRALVNLTCILDFTSRKCSNTGVTVRKFGLASAVFYWLEFDPVVTVPAVLMWFGKHH